MNKNDLIAKVARDTSMTKGDAGDVVEATLESIMGALRSGEEVRLVGFGTFSVSNRSASQGRNPRTGETIMIPASKNPKFKAGKVFKDMINVA